ncbi:MAG: YccF domain-containing protein [Candidatus Limnocylindrales bacterium]
MSEPIQVAPAQPSAPPPVANADAQTSQIVAVQPQGPGFLVRAVWFVLVGWWLTAIVISIAYVLALSILGLPFAFYLFNRIPAFLTLRGRTKTYQVETSADGTRHLTAANVEQRPMLLRAIWFILVGFWFGAIWMSVAYVLCVLIVTMPFGLAMFNRVGAVMTLLRY